MHILTKILVVAVVLLVTALVPLAAVSSTNQDVFKRQAAESKAKVAELTAEGAAQGEAYRASLAGAQAQIAKHEKTISERSGELEDLKARLATANAELADKKLEIQKQTDIAQVMTANDDTQTKLINAMRADLESARTQYLAAEKARMELDDALARLRGDFDSEVAARRQLQEQLQRVAEEKERAMSEVQRYAALHGSMGPRAGATRDAGLPVVADRSLSATVVDVKREPDATLAEINAGSRDGVKEGWVLTIADGSNFIGNLRIVQVDVNRSVGVVELEDVESRGEVKAGQRAIARKGE